MSSRQEYLLYIYSWIFIFNLLLECMVLDNLYYTVPYHWIGAVFLPPIQIHVLSYVGPDAGNMSAITKSGEKTGLNLCSPAPASLPQI